MIAQFQRDVMQHDTRVARVVRYLLPLAVVSACADIAPTDPADALSSPSTTSAAQLATQGDSMAKMLAAALNDASLRQQLLLALRASPVNEHKLVLQDFATTDVGHSALAGAATRSRVDIDQIQRLVRELPRLDFYLPFKAHRLAWEGTPDLVVAAVFDPNAPAIDAWGVDGSVTRLQQSDGVPARPLLILHPEEPKLLRENPQASRVGEVVQDPTDGEAAAAHFEGGDAENDVTAGLRRGEAAPERASASTLLTGVYMNHFNIQEGDGWFGDSEMRFNGTVNWGVPTFTGKFTIWSGGFCDLGTYAQNGVKEDRGYDGLFFVNSGTVTYPVGCPGTSDFGYYGLQIWESDGGLNGEDDNFGYRFYYPGGFPYGAVTGVVQQHYMNTVELPRTAYVRMVVQ